MTYIIRQLDITFQLGTGPFGGTGSNTLKLTGARCLAQIGTVTNNTAVAGGTTAVMRIYGMTLDQMNELTKAGLYYDQRQNLVAIEAGDAGGQKTTVFNGLIIEAYPDFSEGANSAFVVSASTGRAIAMKPVPAISFQSPVAASAAFQQMASNAGMQYENNGVNAQFSAGAYFPGTIMQQISAAAKWANCYAWIDGSTGGNGTLVTVAQNSNRSGDIPEISPTTGMIGYPTYQQNFVVVRNIYNPAVKYWGLINIKSQLKPANGQQRVVGLNYNLSSQIPDGPWEMVVKGVSSTTGPQ